ncbi:MAG: cupin domain-containing protein [Desulfobacteraceae bacterium]|nr:cupin domain-containing protein [Desulfobacteraceae bacterium]MBC2754996.1 cupin domain-containing protein [Desulfobacteraceae bacterium]
MKIFHYTEHKPFPAKTLGIEDASGLSIRFLITQGDGAPNFAMMHLELEPGGCTPNHQHGWEEEIFVKTGAGKIKSGDQTTAICPGDVIYIAPDEAHQFVNTGEENLELLCVIPNNPG